MSLLSRCQFRLEHFPAGPFNFAGSDTIGPADGYE